MQLWACPQLDRMLHQERLERFFGRLTPMERVVLWLLWSGGIRQSDIAGELGCSRQAVGLAVVRIRRKAKEYLPLAQEYERMKGDGTDGRGAEGDLG